MIPIGDDNSDRQLTPIINYALIAINVFVFISFQKMGTDAHFTYAYSTVPAEILTGKDVVTEAHRVVDASGQQYLVPGLEVTPISVYLTLITSMFMHGGWAHLLGNMLYLFVFGDNIENRVGHFRYLVFYLLCGIVASLSHVFSTLFIHSGQLVPSLGASGAISGVLGAYVILFPRRRVSVLLGWFIVAVPAILALGLWILFQVVSGFGMLGGNEDGVAYMAHIGGFIAGIILIKLFDRGPGVQTARSNYNRRYR